MSFTLLWKDEASWRWHIFKPHFNSFSWTGPNCFAQLPGTSSCDGICCSWSSTSSSFPSLCGSTFFAQFFAAIYGLFFLSDGWELSCSPFAQFRSPSGEFPDEEGGAWRFFGAPRFFFCYVFFWLVLEGYTTLNSNPYIYIYICVYIYILKNEFYHIYI